MSGPTSISIAPTPSLWSPGVPLDFYPGQQTGLGSWFRANHSNDSTNGHSWCNYPYDDSDPIFAVSIKAMGGAVSGPDWEVATRKFCGLEAIVSDPVTGKSMLMYIGDAFDEKWVTSPASIDIMIDAFSFIHGDPKEDKHDCIHGVQWELTGRMHPRYTNLECIQPKTKSLDCKTTKSRKLECERTTMDANHIKDTWFEFFPMIIVGFLAFIVGRNWPQRYSILGRNRISHPTPLNAKKRSE